MRVFYFLSSCDTCKRILAELPLDSSIAQIDIKKNPLTASQLEQLHALAGSYEALFSRKAQLYKSLDLKNKTLLEADYKMYLLQHYTFLSRPVFIIDNKIYIGNSQKNSAEVIKVLS